MRRGRRTPARRSRSQNGAQPLARLVRRAVAAPPRAAARAATKAGRAGRPASSWSQSWRSWSTSRAASSVSKASERSRPLRGRPRRTPWCLASRRAVFSASCGTAGQARGLQLQAQRLRAAGHARRQLGEQLERARRVAVVQRPFGREQPRALFGARAAASRRASSSTRRSCSSRSSRSCSRCALPAASRCAERGELGVVRQLGARRPGSRARAAPPCAPGRSGRRSTAPAPRAARPGRRGRGAPTRHSRARRGRPTSACERPGSRDQREAGQRRARAGTG